MEAIDIEHDLVVVEEFDALSIEVINVAELEAQADEDVKRYPAKQHARKVAKELGVDNGIIYLPGQLESTWEDSDQGPPFRQRRYFYYLTGVDFPGCSVTYDIAADKLTLWIPFTPPATILWFGKTPTLEECLAKSDVHDVKYIGELPAYLSARLTTIKSLYALRSAQLPKFDGFEQLRSSLKIDVTSLQPAMDESRVIKSDYEIAMIRRANQISSAAHRKTALQLSGMKNECEIEATFAAACKAANAGAQVYPIIAGSGSNASTLHYEANNEPLAGRQLVVLDAGTEWNCYASDITRTLPLGPRYRFNLEARAIYELVHKMQEECIQRIKPGVIFRDLQLHATFIAVQGLLELGILRNGTAEEIFKNGTGAAFFPHGLGHHVGLDVHDVLSKDLLRPAGESMWGKRRPIGPQSVRAMIKQAANSAAPTPSSPTSTGTSTSQDPQLPPTLTESSPAQSANPPLPPSSPPVAAAATTAEPTSAPSSRKNSSDNDTVNGDVNPPLPPEPQLSRRLPLPPPQRQQTISQLTSDGNGKSKKPKRPVRSALQPNMVVTVGPGIYFCRPYVEAYFLRRPEHARYIDAAALERYWAVGGVRVEDCVLVTPDGREDLTTAPKGRDLLRLMGYA
ncbi:metallopeptidase family M24-domain-containing protein [Daldinia caldariorum]|uniref:metallopeptidase family M24-domain-containing protein n=1 Tax=Daldinia caldariorum TaxID=326644 RepID=UPI002007B168|nr:metallopeptidase family M24-domain-containing protein [Daldinia caldariorum]KAI1469556.1 metallopeptidase family M24-domain-containing protein [Daldinia caldariorum]